MAYKKFFPAQGETERVFLLIRRHWFTYVIFLLLPVLMLIPLIAVIVYWLNDPTAISEEIGNVILVFGSIYLLLIIAILLYGFVDYYLDVYIVTDRRIVDIKQNGFFKREISELHLHQVQDVNAKVNGFFPTLLHFGEVFIQTAGEIDNFIFNAVPHPYRISKKVIDLHEQSLGGRTRFKNASGQTGLNVEGEPSPKSISDSSGQVKNFMRSTGLRETISSDEEGEDYLAEHQTEILKNIDKDKGMQRSQLGNGESSDEGILHEGEEKIISK